jgi:hypothetical protein
MHHTGPDVAHSEWHTIVGLAVPFWHVTNDWGLWCIQQQVPYNWVRLYSHTLARYRMRSHKLLFSWRMPKVTAFRWCRNCSLFLGCLWYSKKCLLWSIFWHQFVVEIAMLTKNPRCRFPFSVYKAKFSSVYWACLFIQRHLICICFCCLKQGKYDDLTS